MYRNSGILDGMLVGRKSFYNKMSIFYCKERRLCAVYFSPIGQSNTGSIYGGLHVHQDGYTNYHRDVSGRYWDTNHTVCSSHSEDSFYTRMDNDTPYLNPLDSIAVHICDIFHRIL